MTTWKLFVLGRDKTPLPNCSTCAAAGPEHDREACDHLTCHGFYAATDDSSRLREMKRLHPDGHWAVRTGQASGIVVLDAEGHGTPSGVDVLDDWENWVGGWPLQTTDRIALTPSGGVHRYYAWAPGIKSRNRVLPGIDIKSDGGYVVIPDIAGERRWALDGIPAELTSPMLEWFRSARGKRATSEGATALGDHSQGYNFQLFLREGCPGGMRDEFFNELIFRLRKSGADLHAIYTEVRRQWQRCAQPDRPIFGTPAQWHMPWHHVEYKIKRIWQTVEVDDVGDELRAWANAQRTGEQVIVTKRVTTMPRA